MSQNKYENYRIGLFAAVNTGKISGCSVNTHFKAKYSGSGFVHDNKGEISNSLSLKPIGGKIHLAGFVYRNGGTIRNSGFVGTVRKDTSDADENTKKKSRYIDEEMAISSDLSNEEIYRELELGNVWKNEDQGVLHPDFKRNHVALEPFDEERIIKISDSQTLIDIIRDINDGVQSAVEGYYVLTDNINLGGKAIEPIGASESNAFRGVFDGRGKKISNFTVKAKGRQYAGLFGFAKNATVINLKIDCVVDGTDGENVGAMVGVNNGSRFENCVVISNVKPGLCTGQFVGKNSGTIINCYVCGKVQFPVLIPPLWPLAFLAALLLIPVGVRLFKDDGGYVPEVIDPNQVPIIEKDDIPKPQAGTSRISFEVNHEIYISSSTGVGQMNYKNPARATQDVVVHILVSDSELTKAGYNLSAIGVRTPEQMAAEGYDPNTSYTELYRSGLVQVGFAIDNCKLSPLPNRQMLKPGDYEMTLKIDGYNPETHERSIINTNVPVTVHIV